MKTWQHLLTATATTMILGVSAMSLAEDGHKDQRKDGDCGRGGHHKMMSFGGSDHRLKKMAHYLDLTEEQQAQIEEFMVPSKEAHKEKREQMEQLHKQFRQAIDEGAPESQLQALADQLGQQVASGAMEKVRTMQFFKSILTTEQLEKMEKMKEHRGKKRRGHEEDLTSIEGEWQVLGSESRVLVI